MPRFWARLTEDYEEHAPIQPSPVGHSGRGLGHHTLISEKGMTHREHIDLHQALEWIRDGKSALERMGLQSDAPMALINRRYRALNSALGPNDSDSYDVRRQKLQATTILEQSYTSLRYGDPLEDELRDASLRMPPLTTQAGEAPDSSKQGRQEPAWPTTRESLLQMTPTEWYLAVFRHFPSNEHFLDALANKASSLDAEQSTLLLVKHVEWGSETGAFDSNELLHHDGIQAVVSHSMARLWQARSSSSAFEAYARCKAELMRMGFTGPWADSTSSDRPGTIVKTRDQRGAPSNQQTPSLTPRQVRYSDILTPLSQVEATKALARTEIHGSDVGGVSLTTKLVEQFGMSPAYRLEVGGVEILLPARLYAMRNGRVALIAFVEDPHSRHRDNGSKTYIARTYYRSNSQGGSFRLLPSIKKSETGLGWYSKGYDENSLSAPAKLFAAICELRIRGGVNRKLDEQSRRLLFGGTVLEHKRYGLEPGTYAAVMANTPYETRGSAEQIGLADPESVRVREHAAEADLEVSTGTFLCEYPISSDGIPRYVVPRRSDQSQRPDMYALSPIEEVARDGSTWVSVSLPNGGELRFERSRETGLYALTTILGNGQIRSSDIPRLPRQPSLDGFHVKAGGYLVLLDDDGLFNGLITPSGTMYDPIMGAAAVRRFPSQGVPHGLSTKLEYLIHTDHEGRSMVGSLLVPGVVNSLGLYGTWAQCRDLLKPIYEYPAEIGPYGDPSDRRRDYVNAWRNYVRKLPLIARFTDTWGKIGIPDCFDKTFE